MIHELLGCPYPSVAAILLQQLKQLIADSWPPAPEALELAAEWLLARVPCQAPRCLPARRLKFRI